VLSARSKARAKTRRTSSSANELRDPYFFSLSDGAVLCTPYDDGNRALAYSGGKYTSKKETKQRIAKTQ
jgi:hypothetical protein